MDGSALGALLIEIDLFAGVDPNEMKQNGSASNWIKSVGGMNGIPESDCGATWKMTNGGGYTEQQEQKWEDEMKIEQDVIK